MDITANFASPGANSGYNIRRVVEKPKEVMMRTTHTLATADALFVMPDDGVRYELVRGELRRMPPAGSEHGAVIPSQTPWTAVRFCQALLVASQNDLSVQM